MIFNMQRIEHQMTHIQASGTADDEAAAVALVRDMRTQGTLAAFSAGQQVPRRPYTIEELRLNGIEPEKCAHCDRAAFTLAVIANQIFTHFLPFLPAFRHFHHMFRASTHAIGGNLSHDAPAPEPQMGLVSWMKQPSQ